MMPQPSYFDAMGYAAMIADYGRPETFVDEIARMPRDRLRRLQNERFLKVMAFAWKIPFYRRHGFEVAGEVQFPSGPTIWPMWRDPQPPG